MRKKILSSLSIGLILSAVIFTSCDKNDDDNSTAPPVVVTDQSFTEEFDNINTAVSKGWVIKNTSDPNVPLVWANNGGTPAFFPAFSGSGFVGVNAIISAPSIEVLSNWLISPKITFQNGDTISFYTRAKYEDEGNYGGSPGDLNDFGNRLQLRLNLLNDSTNVGNGTTSGDFTSPLLDINPTYNANTSYNTPAENDQAFPATWKQYKAVIYGLNQPKTGRFALRYLIEDGNNNGSGIGIDKVEYKSVH